MFLYDAQNDSDPYKASEKNRKIYFLIDRIYGVPSPDYVSNQSSEFRELFENEGGIFEANEYYADINRLDCGVIDVMYEEEFRKFQQDVDLYCGNTNLETQKLYLSMDSWTLSDALSLWIGSVPLKNGNIVAWGYKNQRLADSAADVVYRWDVIRSAVESNRLNDPCPPCDFARWAVKKELTYPEFFDCLTEEAPIEISSAEVKHQSASEIEILKKEIFDLNKELLNLRKSKNDHYAKLFAALCVAVYGYKKGRGIRNAATRNIRVAAEIVKDASPPTVLKWIKESIVLLPESDQKKLAMIHLETEVREGKFELVERKRRTQ